MDAILIVDLQRAFAPPPEVLRRIQLRAATFPRRIFTRFVNPSDSLFRRKLARRSCAPDSPESDFVIAPEPGDIVLVKPGYGLAETHIRHLRDAEIGRVLVCGGDTDACVLGVLFSLFDAGIDCSVDPDLCWSASGLQEPALRIIAEQFGTPADLAAVAD